MSQSNLDEFDPEDQEVSEEPELEAFIPIPLDKLQEGDKIYYITVSSDDEVATPPTEATFKGVKGEAQVSKVYLRGEFPGEEHEGVTDYWTGAKKIQVMKVLNRDVDILGLED